MLYSLIAINTIIHNLELLFNVDWLTGSKYIMASVKV